ncbi:phosphate propanoyltransferase [Lentilactobacillus senioris]|uniref:phosphate propanoyltransferase n=1 Tax=Lentilactobacillus senioris TaxID=931534 RepID=UPI003D290ADE
MDEEQLRNVIRKIIDEELNGMPSIPIGVSNHHVHLTDEDFNKLFPGQTMTVFKQLKQPSDFASEQKVTLVGANGAEIPNVRILGPTRSHSQVEISKSETFTLGIDAPIRLSGDLEGAPSIKIKSEFAEITVQGVIIAKRHIHMSMDDAAKFGVKYGDIVKVEVQSKDRKIVFDDVVARPREDFVLEMHIDTDEAGAANVQGDTVATMVTDQEEN